MTEEIVIQIVLSLLIVLFFIGAFLSTLTEIAFNEASSVSMRRFLDKPFGKLGTKFVVNKERSIKSARILNIFSIIGYSMCLIICGVRYFYQQSYPWVGPLITTFIAVVSLVLLAEIIPTIVAKKSAEKTVIFVSPWFSVFYYLFYPITSFSNFLGELFGRVMHVKKTPEISEKELSEVVSDVFDEGAIEKDEHDLIQNSLSFDDKKIYRIMTPFSKVIYITNEMDLDEIKKVFLESSYSRIPYIDAKSGEVIGFILMKDFYEMLISENTNLEELINVPLFFSSNVNASIALKRLQKFRQQMAFVRSVNTKKVIGIITVEDLVEEIVGEIEDESDAEDIEEKEKQNIENKVQEVKEEEKMNEKENFSEDSEILPSIENEDEEDEEDDEDESSEDNNIVENEEENVVDINYDDKDVEKEKLEEEAKVLNEDEEDETESDD